MTTTTVQLGAIHLNRFKGITAYDVTFAGNDYTLFGDNGTGKTTLIDGFLWCLFGRNSAGDADFNILQISPTGETHTEAEVTVNLLVNGKGISLRRGLKVNMVTKRGTIERVRQGTTGVYHVDDVPVQLGEFNQQVSAIFGGIDPKRLALLTDARKFNEDYPWQQARALLVEMAGDVTLEDVIAAHPDRKLDDLPAVLGDHTPVAYRKILGAQHRETNDELNTLPARISEVERQIGEGPLEGLKDPGLIQAAIEVGDTKLASLRQDLADVRAGGASREARARLLEVEAEIGKAEEDAARKHRDAVHRARLAVDEQQAEHGRRAAAVATHARQLATLAADRERVEAQLADARTKYAELRAATVDVPPDAVESVCPGCGQPLPAEQVDQARQRLLERANTERTTALRALLEQGQHWQQMLEAMPKPAAAPPAPDDDALEAAKEHLAMATAAKAPDAPGVQALRVELEDLKRRVATVDTTAETTRIDAEIRAIEAQQAERRQDLAHVAAKEAGFNRLRELQDQHRTLAKEAERIRHHTWMLDEYTRTQAKLVSDRVNGLFEIARVRLFEIQDNGGVKEICTTTVDEVPYADLNNGKQVNVGLDVVRALQRHHGLSMPVFVDNAESVTRLLPMDAQVIRLVVSEADKTLRAEQGHPQLSFRQRNAIPEA